MPEENENANVVTGTVEPPAAAPAVEDAPAAQKAEQKVREEVTQEMLDRSSHALAVMLDHLKLDASVKAENRVTKINLLVTSSDAGRIIGRKGQSLESLQLLLNRMMQKDDQNFPKVYIDIDGYASSKGGTSKRGGGRPRRRQEEGGDGEESEFDATLRQQAIDAAKEVRRWGEPVTLPPMNAHDRRIIHITLENESDIHTESEGEGARKSVVISMKK